MPFKFRLVVESFLKEGCFMQNIISEDNLSQPQSEILSQASSTYVMGNVDIILFLRDTLQQLSCL